METREVTRNGVQFSVGAGPYDWFWDKFEQSWEGATLAAFDACFHPGGTFLDIGSWIGPTALYAASRGQRVICIEADPIALAELRKNVALNPTLAPRITIIDKAIYPESGTVRFGSKTGRTAGDSASSFAHDDFSTAWTVETITPDELVAMAADSETLFVKVDIEGGEYTVFPPLMQAFRDLRPTVLLSFHPQFLSCGFIRGRRLSNAVFRAGRGFKIHKVREKKRSSSRTDALVLRGLSHKLPTGAWLFKPVAHTRP